MNLKAILGFVGHYRLFTKGFIHIAQPLHEHLSAEGVRKKNEQVMLPDNALGAFEMLKKTSLEAPVLAFADFYKPFLLKTDASKQRLGAVLSQKQAMDDIIQ